MADLSQGKISVCGKGKLVFVKSSSVNWSNAGEELLSLYTNFELRRWIDFCDGTIFTEKKAHILDMSSLLG